MRVKSTLVLLAFLAITFGVAAPWQPDHHPERRRVVRRRPEGHVEPPNASSALWLLFSITLNAAVAILN